MNNRMIAGIAIVVLLVLGAGCMAVQSQKGGADANGNAANAPAANVNAAPAAAANVNAAAGARATGRTKTDDPIKNTGATGKLPTNTGGDITGDIGQPMF